MKIFVIGIDPAFANMGLCGASICSSTGAVDLGRLHLVSTEGRDRKEVRKNSDDLRRARELSSELHKFSRNATVAFAEVPVGSQSARASWALGIAVGVLASCPIPMIQVTPAEVKIAAVGKKNASKSEMIEWAVAKYPQADWIRCRGRLTNANEHLADAVATVYAGIQTEEFQRMMALVGISHRPVKRVILK